MKSALESALHTKLYKDVRDTPVYHLEVNVPTVATESSHSSSSGSQSRKSKKVSGGGDSGSGREGKGKGGGKGGGGGVGASGSASCSTDSGTGGDTNSFNPTTDELATLCARYEQLLCGLEVLLIYNVWLSVHQVTQVTQY